MKKTTVVQVAFLLAALAAAGLALASQWHRVGHQFSTIGVTRVVVAFLLVLPALVANTMVWRALLADLGSPLSIRAAVRIVFLGQIGKYLPGSVWPVLAQMQLARRDGVPRDRSASASIIALVVSVVTGAVIGLLTVPALLHGSGARYLLVLVALPVGGVFLHPAVVNRAIALVLRITRQPPLEHALSWRGILEACGCCTVAFAFYGLQAFVLLHHGLDALPLAVGGYALGVAAGLAFIPAPAGAGVRETILVLTFGAVVGTSAALAAALVSRLVTVAADIFVASATMAVGGAIGSRVEPASGVSTDRE